MAVVGFIVKKRRDAAMERSVGDMGGERRRIGSRE
jgi:hypothetical protein